MKKRQRNFEIFNLSFLDVISCGFGAVVLLVLISPFGESVLPDFTSQSRQLLEDVLEAEARVTALESSLEAETREAEDAAERLIRESSRAADARAALRAAEEEAAKLRREVAGLEQVERSLQDQERATITTGDATTRDEEVGGVPVDADYVVFIVDTSGSMQSIWGRVTRELENIIRIHPRIKGFQILNDNGLHLLSGYQGRWIPDTPQRRESVIRLFRSWQSTSNSSPVEGLEVALKRYVRPGEKTSIYIFGDDYTGSSYDAVIRTLTNLNRNRVTGRPKARVHAVGFLSISNAGRFETLMREVTRQNNGTFIALPVR
ncbi:MAG: VWA domain-containing protein [Alphaproteobacteria bacterium]|nr:VWA domain-containing protein [Alphaproteobacteria bacterium]